MLLRKEQLQTKKSSYLRRLDALEERMSSILTVDHPCAQKCIVDTRNFVEVSDGTPNATVMDRTPEKV